MKYTQELLDEMDEYGRDIGLHPSLLHYPRTKQQADTLLRLQEYCTSDQTNLYYKWYKKQSTNDPKRGYEKAIKALNYLADYLPKYNHDLQDRALIFNFDKSRLDTYGIIEKLRTMVNNHHNNERITQELFIRQTKDELRSDLKHIELSMEFYSKGAGKFFYENTTKTFSDTTIEKDLLPILISFIKL